MNYKLGLIALLSVCACSITDSDPDQTTSPDMGTAEPTSPDAESPPSNARLIPEPVDSVEDVPGRYAQPFALPGQISAITIGSPNFGMGNYELFRSCGVPNCVPEAGQFHIVPTNPAIGFAAISLVDQTGTVRTTYILDLLWRDSGGRLVAIQLRALLGNTTGPTQVWWRLPDGNGGNDDDPITRTMDTHADVPSPTVIAAPDGTSNPKLAGTFVRALPVYGDIGAITLDDTIQFGNIVNGTYNAAYPYCLPWCFGEAGGAASSTSRTSRPVRAGCR